VETGGRIATIREKEVFPTQQAPRGKLAMSTGPSYMLSFRIHHICSVSNNHRKITEILAGSRRSKLNRGLANLQSNISQDLLSGGV
jgi:hypothetical protein